MNSQPFLSADTTSEPLPASDIINLLQQGKTLGEITVQTGLSRLVISKLLNTYGINHRIFINERQHAKYQKTFSKCYTLAVKLNRIPRISETMSISGISVFRSQINQDLMAHGFHNAGKYNLPPPLTGNTDVQIPVGQIPPVIAHKKDIIQLLSQISKDLGSNLSKKEIVAKVSQNMVIPCFSLPPFFSQEKMKAYNYYRDRKKKKNEKLLLRLITISNQLGYSAGKDELRKIDKSLYQKLYRSFGGLHNALKAAGLDKKSKSKKNNAQRARNEFIEKLKQYIEQSRKIPEPGELQNLFGISIHKVKKLFSSYSSAIRKTGFSPPLELTRKNYQKTEMLISKLRQAIILIGRPLKHHEYQIYCGSSFATYTRRFGSVKKAHQLATEGYSTETEK